MEIRDMKVYQISLELAFGVFEIALSGAKKEKIHWLESMKKTCVGLSLNVAQGDVECYRVAQQMARETAMLLELGFEEKFISESQRRQIHGNVEGVLKALARWIKRTGKDDEF